MGAAFLAALHENRLINRRRLTSIRPSLVRAEPSLTVRSCTITLDILMGGPLTGAAMNPARAFGPELVQNFWSHAWIYYVGPPLAAGLNEWLYLRPLAPIPVGPPETGVREPRPGETAVS